MCDEHANGKKNVRWVQEWANVNTGEAREQRLTENLNDTRTSEPGSSTTRGWNSRNVRPKPRMGRARRLGASARGERAEDVDAGANDDWYTFKHGENTRWLVERSGLDMDALQQLNPNVDLSVVFPGDRIVIRDARTLSPSERKTTVVVGEAPKVKPPAKVITARTSVWNSPFVLSGVLVAGTLSVTGLFNRKRLTSTYATWRTSQGWVGADAHSATVGEMQMLRDAAEREVEQLRGQGERYEKTLENLREMLASASRGDAVLREQIGDLKKSLNSKATDVARLEKAHEDEAILAERYKHQLGSAEVELEVLRVSAARLVDVTNRATQYEGDILNLKDKLIDVESELMALRELSDGYSSEAVASKNKFKSALSELESVKRLNTVLEESLSEAKQSISSYLSTIESYKTDIGVLKSELTGRDHDISTLSSNLSEAHESTRTLNSALQSSRNEASELSRHLENVRTELETVKSNLNLSETKVTSYVADLASYKSKLEQVEAALKDAHEDATVKADDLTKASNELANATMALLKSNSALESTRLEVASLTESFSESQSYASSLKSLLTMAQAESTILTSEAINLQSELKTASSAQRASQEELLSVKAHYYTVVAEMEERIKSAQAEARVLADDKDSLEVQLTKLEQAMGRLTEEKDSEIEQKEVVAEQLADLEQIKAELDASLELAQMEVAELTDALSESKYTIESLESSLEAAKDDADKLKGDNQSIRKEMKSVEAELAAVQAEMSEKLSDIEVLKENEAEQLQAIESLTRAVGAVESNLSEANVRADSIASELESARMAMSGLESDLSQKLSAANAEIAAANERAAMTSSELESALSTVSSLKAELMHARTQAASGDSIAVEYAQKLAVAESEIARANERAAKTSSELIDLTHKLSAAIADVAVSNRRVELTSIELDSTTAVVASLESELMQLRTQVVSGDSVATGYVEKLAAAEFEITKVNKRAAMAASELESSRSTILDLESELMQLRTQVVSGDSVATGYVEKLAAAEFEITKANERAQRYKERLSQLEESMQNQNNFATLNDSSVEFAEPTEELMLLRERVSQLEFENASATSTLVVLQGELNSLRSVDAPPPPRWELDARLAEMEVALAEANRAAQLSLAQVTRTMTNLQRQAAGDRPSHTISCEFKVNKDVGAHQFIILVGTWCDWDIQLGEYMSRLSDGSWSAKIPLSSDEAYEYKYCICELTPLGARVPVEWQVGHNHCFGFDSTLITSQKMLPKAQIRDKWLADPAHNPIIIYGASGEKFETGSTRLLANMSHNIAEQGIESARMSIEELSAMVNRTLAMVRGKTQFLNK